MLLILWVYIMGGQGGNLSYGFHIYKDDDDEVVQHLGLTQQAEAVSAILCFNRFVLIQVPFRLLGFSSQQIHILEWKKHSTRFQVHCNSVLC